MNVTWDDWQVVHAAWTHGSFTAAARALGVGQATVSRRVAAVEASLGQVLFDRHKTGLVPTAAAHRVRPHLEALAAAALGATHALDGFEVAAVGEVRIAAPPGLAHDLLPELALRLARTHPGLHLEVLADIGPANLRHREADLALRLMPTAEGELLSRRLTTLDGGLYAARSLLDRLPAAPTAAQVPLVAYSHDLAHIPLARLLEQTGAPIVFRCNDYLVLREAIVRGLGAGLVGHLEAQRLALRPLPLPLAEPARLPVHLVVHRALRHVPRVAAVISAIDALLDELQPHTVGPPTA